LERGHSGIHWLDGVLHADVVVTGGFVARSLYAVERKMLNRQVGRSLGR
jgi:hypothetical protein